MDKISKKDVYNRLWEGRNFEIEHLWQRSIFLGAFLILFFTVYFTLLSSVFSAAKDASVNQSVISAEATMRGTVFTVAEKEEPDSSDILKYLCDNKGANAALLVITLLGVSFSLLWVFMAKGSKYWYEKYEKSIDEMQEDEELFDDDINREWRIEEAKAKLEYREAHHIPIQGYMPHKDSNDSVFSNKGGAYSLSKVNVSIGHVFCLFWFLISAFHIYLFFDSSFHLCIAFYAFLISVVVFVLLTTLIGNSTRSGEADWACFFRVFTRRRINRKFEYEGVFRKINENKWFIKLLEDYLIKGRDRKNHRDEELQEKELNTSEREKNVAEELSEHKPVDEDKEISENSKKRNEEKFEKIPYQIEEASQSEIIIKALNRFGGEELVKKHKIRTAVKYPKNENSNAWMSGYLQEYIFTKVNPLRLRGEWTSPRRRSISFCPEHPDNEKSKQAIDIKGNKPNDVEDEKNFLVAIFNGLFPTSACHGLEVRKFADIPWKALNSKKRVRKRELASLENAEEWTLHYILCDKDDKFLGCEIFNYSFSNGREKLKSSLISQDGVKIRDYIWKRKDADKTGETK